MSKDNLPPKGFRDILPQEASLREETMRIILNTFKKYGFNQIETPALDYVERLKKSEGGENLSMIFEILKRGDKFNRLNLSPTIDRNELVDLALRYDLTVPLARFYACHVDELLSPFKSIQIGSVWRAEKPQKGRYRQFIQCDVDIIGLEEPYGEVEVIPPVMDAIRTLGFKNTWLRLSDRRLLDSLLDMFDVPRKIRSNVVIILDKADKIGIPRVREELDDLGVRGGQITNTLERILSEPTNEGRLKAVSTVLDSSKGQIVVDNFKRMFDVVSSVVEDIVFDPLLARGMGYYTGAIFELSSSDFDSSLAGGGRYDTMIGKLSGRPAPACGFSIGFERIILLIMEGKVKVPKGDCATKVALLYDKKDMSSLKRALATAQAMRSDKTYVSLLPKPKKLSKFLDKLKEEDFSAFAIVDSKTCVENIELRNLT